MGRIPVAGPWKSDAQKRCGGLFPEVSGGCARLIRTAEKRNKIRNEYISQYS